MNLVPKTLTLPAIPIRDMVLFPAARVPFVVGRKASVRTLELAIKAGDHLLMLTQKDPKIENPGQEDLFPIGTLALVESVIALPKDYYKVGVKGIARVTLRRYMDEGEVLQAEAYLLPEPAAAGTEDLDAFHVAAEAFLARNPDAARMLSMEQLKELPLGKAVDSVSQLVPAEVRQKQHILEQTELAPRLEALLDLLEMDEARSEVERTVDEKTRARLDQDHKQYVL
ncbi:MAG TPA: LON peptidase substrate-binding domain-containing protein, partial [Holophagaceae bacterium]|nr:LON peptidase substrate-binding domain-containing protein [Holophagaceae bacterium]